MAMGLGGIMGVHDDDLDADGSKSVESGDLYTGGGSGSASASFASLTKSSKTGTAGKGGSGKGKGKGKGGTRSAKTSGKVYGSAKKIKSQESALTGSLDLMFGGADDDDD